MAGSVLEKEIKNAKFEKATELFNAITSGNKTSSHDYMMRGTYKLRMYSNR